MKTHRLSLTVASLPKTLTYVEIFCLKITNRNFPSKNNDSGTDDGRELAEYLVLDSTHDGADIYTPFKWQLWHLSKTRSWKKFLFDGEKYISLYI